MRKLLAILAALSLSLALVTPAAAYTKYPNAYRWATGNASGGYDFNIPVCLHQNFQDGSGWNFSFSRHSRVADALDHFNSLSYELHYYRTNTACSTLTSNGIDHLTVAWEYPNNVTDGNQAYISFTNKEGFPCVTNCVHIATIYMQQNGDPDLSGLTWYYGNDWTVPSGKRSFEESFLHELGHAGALDHSNNVHAVMCANDLVAGDCDIKAEIIGPGESVPQYRGDDISGFDAIWDIH